MKKLLSLLLCFCMVFAFGCANEAAPNPSAGGASGGASSSDGPVHVVIWGIWQLDNYRGKWMQDKANEYAAQFENVTIEYIYQNSYNGVAEKLTAGAMSGELPTLAQMEESFITMFNPICLNFQDYMSEETIKNFNEGLMVTGNWDGKVLAVPANRSAPVIYMNADILNECGLDPNGLNTWDDLYNYAKTVHEKTGKYGFSVYWDSDAWLWESALYSWGGQITSDDGLTVTYNDEGKGVKVLELYQKMVAEGIAFEPFSQASTDESSDITLTKFIDQEAAIISTSCGGYGAIKDAAKFNIQAAYMPIGTQRSMVTGGANWIMPKGSTEEEIKHAVGFIEFLNTDENNLNWMQTSGYMPHTYSVIQSEAMQQVFEADPNYKVFVEQLQYAHARPTTPYWREMYMYIVEKLEASMMDTSLDPAAVIADCAANSQAIIDANK